MYLRHTTRKKDGKVHRYWSLVRSVRVGRRVIQQTVAHLGELDEQGRLEARALSARLIGTPEQAPLFADGTGHLTVPVRLKEIRIASTIRSAEEGLARYQTRSSREPYANATGSLAPTSTVYGCALEPISH
jgi:hypothetical protein